MYNYERIWFEASRHFAETKKKATFAFALLQKQYLRKGNLRNLCS